MLYPKHPWDANYYSSKEEFQLWLMQEWDAVHDDWYREYYIRSTAEPMGNKSYREDTLIETFWTREDAEEMRSLLREIDEAERRLEELNHNVECLVAWESTKNVDREERIQQKIRSETRTE
jgi:hypothetical protein